MKVVFGPTGGGKTNFYPFFVWDFLTKFNKSVIVKLDSMLQRSFAYHAPDTNSENDCNKTQKTVVESKVPEVF